MVKTSDITKSVDSIVAANKAGRAKAKKFVRPRDVVDVEEMIESKAKGSSGKEIAKQKPSSGVVEKKPNEEPKRSSLPEAKEPRRLSEAEKGHINKQIGYNPERQANLDKLNDTARKVDVLGRYTKESLDNMRSSVKKEIDGLAEKYDVSSAKLVDLATRSDTQSKAIDMLRKQGLTKAEARMVMAATVATSTGGAYIAGKHSTRKED